MILTSGGYSAFYTELLRGKTAFPKETVYFFRKGAKNNHPPPSEFQCSVKALHNEWTNLRSPLFSTLSTILDSTQPLTGTPSLDYESLGVNFYDADRSMFRWVFLKAGSDSPHLASCSRN
ncbi:hypothetical protein N7516_011501 [Penicillium verrucosum]|uniref:uncharacterized protein n=1 Tax=Penicillium verrucosum TaxID=60171 RepID=UPI0025457C27|nr:uncharacterized protein N7516_011501 [Penicillium verrucosum]KAJ5920643.1 hypothetical protein N7516_011501 [Penicillium verrucosum]